MFEVDCTPNSRHTVELISTQTCKNHTRSQKIVVKFKRKQLQRLKLEQVNSSEVQSDS